MNTDASRQKRFTLPHVPAFQKGMNHFNVWLALEADAAHVHLIKHSEAAFKRNKFRENNASMSMWSGACALRERRDSELRAVRENGELLFCWHGTKAIEVAA